MRLETRLDELERELLATVSAENLIDYAAKIATQPRLSGSPEERNAFEYIVGQLRSWGLDPELRFHDGYVSWPIDATLEVAGVGHIDCITHAMATSTEGTTGELVYVRKGGEADYQEASVRGKIAVIDGLAAPAAVRRAAAQGSIAQIFVNDEHLHEMITSAVWGNPTLEQCAELPTTPCVSVNQRGGDTIKEALVSRPVSATLRTRVETSWRELPLLSVDIVGDPEPERFVLFSGHVDSWHLGAMDNAGANACMMEIARLLNQQRHALKRSVRLCFWSGHSHGRYAGSAWYADHFWNDLYRNCVAHVYIDSVGGKGATLLSQGFAMSETRDLGRAVLEKHAGVAFEGTRPTRSGDQSFLSLGIPSLLMTVSEQPAGSDSVGPAAITGSKSGGLGYWWHTVHDTLDKLDPDFLARDCQLYLAVIYRLSAEAVLPFNYQTAVEEFLACLTEYRQLAANRFDLSPATARAERLLALATKLAARADELRRAPGHEPASYQQAVREVNDTMIRLGRLLIPANYTVQGPFGQDPALPIDPVPILSSITKLASTAGGTASEKHLGVGLVRARNQVCHVLDEAIEMLERAHQ